MASGSNFDVNTEDLDSGILRPNGWPQGRRFDSRWTHSDMKDVAYYFNFKFYGKIVEKGGLK